MDHPVQIILPVTRFLDRVLDEYAIQLLVLLIWGLVALLVWAISRRNRPGEVRIHAVLLPLGRVSRDLPFAAAPPPEPCQGIDPDVP